MKFFSQTGESWGLPPQRMNTEKQKVNGSIGKPLILTPLCSLVSYITMPQKEVQGCLFFFFIDTLRMGRFIRISQKSEVKLLAVGSLPVFVNMLNYTDCAVKGLDLFYGGVCNCQGTPNVKYSQSSWFKCVSLDMLYFLYNKFAEFKDYLLIVSF